MRRLPWARPVRVAQPEQLAAGHGARGRDCGARALRAAGVTVTFAPVADVPSVRGAALAGRVVLARPGAWRAAPCAPPCRAGEPGGVAATAKHFPGLGGAPANTDDAIVTIRRSRAALDAVDLPPFAAAIAAGVPLVMVGHARYPALDRFRIASQSRPIVRGPAARRARLPRRRRHRLDRGARRRSRRGASRRCPSAPSAPARTSCCSRAAAPTRRFTSTCSRSREALARAPRARARVGCPRPRAQDASEASRTTPSAATVRAHAEVAQEPVLEPVDQAVHGQLLAARPRVLDDRRLADVDRPARRRSARTAGRTGARRRATRARGGASRRRRRRGGASCRSSPCREPSSAAATPPQP